MKKYFILIFSIIIASQGLNAMSAQEIITQLQTQSNNYKEVLNPNISMHITARSKRLND